MIRQNNKSIEIILKNQHNSGSFISSPNIEAYQYCFLRDGSFIAYALDLMGYSKEAEKFFSWTNKVVQNYADKAKKAIKRLNNNEPLLNSDYLHSRFTLDGKESDDEWPNFQLDGYGVWLWALCQHIKLSDNKTSIDDFKESIHIITQYLAAFWKYPCFDCWEEKNDKIHTTTLSSIYGAFIELDSLLPNQGYKDTADEVKGFILKNCVFNNRLSKHAFIDDIDSSLISTAIPFGLMDVNNEIIKNTICEIEKQLLDDKGLHRYPTDVFYGGGQWIILTCWLAWYYIELGNKAKAEELLSWVEKQANSQGELPEQVLDHVYSPEYIEKWHEIFGEVACPSLWAHAMYLVTKHKFVYS